MSFPAQPRRLVTSQDIRQMRNLAQTKTLRDVARILGWSRITVWRYCKGMRARGNVKGRIFVQVSGVKCPKCGKSNISSHGINYRCRDCNTYFRKVYKRKPSIAIILGIVCPKCGSHKVRSEWKFWHCLSCGSYWVKNRKREILIPAIRPKNPCPTCGKTHIRSRGAINWWCVSCGRTFRKSPVRKVSPVRRFIK